ncbi:hypothetical protein CKM354_000741800 [Cercospora kikuchii]|uniref:Uncharacterized protein n=1 Tax=Cercospora kikuchii TaxID=84275 RepID=A0A9P3CH02_9PEZI|nr:uncharacterized protein CKM354_000741800 [Cercospora kikuchii]GIZ44214.1 hypothetical protein CKM354_000741800 [Cercospora kikuchii]
MARLNQTNYRTHSSVKPTEREVRAYRVEQADRILLERVANVRTTLMQPRVGKRSSAAPYAPRSSSSTTSTSNAVQHHASTISSYSASTFQSSTQYQPARRQARRQQFRPLGGVLNTTYSSAAHLRESKLYLDALERTAQHEARMNAESEAMFQENKQRREEWAEWTRNLYHSGAVRMASEKASTASVASIAQSSVIVEHDQQLAAESEGVNLTGLRPQETHGEQSPPSDQVVAQEADHIQASEAQQAEQVEFGQVGSKNEEVAQYPPLSFPLKVKKVKKQIIVGSTLAATFPAASRQVFQRVLYTDGTRVWIKVQVQGNGMVEAEALEALPQVRKRSLLVEDELEEPRKRQLTADHAFQIVETHIFADEMPAEYRNEERDEIDGSVVHVGESKAASPEERDKKSAVVLFQEVSTASKDERGQVEPAISSLEEVKSASQEVSGEASSGIFHAEEVGTISEERHEDDTAIVSHEEAEVALGEEHTEADPVILHVEELEATSEEERPEEVILDDATSNEVVSEDEEEEVILDEATSNEVVSEDEEEEVVLDDATSNEVVSEDEETDDESDEETDDEYGEDPIIVRGGTNPYWRPQKGKKKITSQIESDVNHKGECVDCGKQTYRRPHVCYNQYPEMASSYPWYGRQAGIHIDAEGAEKIPSALRYAPMLTGQRDLHTAGDPRVHDDPYDDELNPRLFDPAVDRTLPSWDDAEAGHAWLREWQELTRQLAVIMATQPGTEPVVPLVGRGTCVSKEAIGLVRNRQIYEAAIAMREANARAQQSATEGGNDVSAMSTVPDNAPTGPRDQTSRGYYAVQAEELDDAAMDTEAGIEMLPQAAAGLGVFHQQFRDPDNGASSPRSGYFGDVDMSGTGAVIEEQRTTWRERAALRENVQRRDVLLPFSAPTGPRNRSDSRHRHQIVQESSNTHSLGQRQYFRRPAQSPGDKDGDIDMIGDTPSSSQALARHGRDRPQAGDRYGNINMPDASAAPPQPPRRQNHRARGRRQDVDSQGNVIMSDTTTTQNRQPLRTRDTNVSNFRRPAPQQHHGSQRSLSTTPTTQYDLEREENTRRREAAKAQRQAGTRGADRPLRRNAVPNRTDENDSVGLRIRGAAKERGESMRDARYAD